ncbi:hypothetical protein CCH79_00013941, partial [Gambusia affinis]
MKLGLLALLVLAALLPHLSDSRIVPKCELKETLAAAINKTRGPEGVTEEILAEIICEVNRSSNLNTSLVKTKGFGSRHKREASSRGRHHSEETDSYEENMIQERKMEKHREHESDEDSFEISEEVEEVSNSTSVLGNRRKRGAHERRKNHSRVKGKGNSPERKRGHDSNESEDMSNGDSHETTEEGHDSSESGDMSYERTAASASYGIFQLSDSYLCDSGNNLSRNLCQKSCTDFTDDDITDDIECFLKAFFDGGPALTTVTMKQEHSSKIAPKHESEESQESLNDMENKFDEEEMERDDEHISKESSSEEGESSHLKMRLWSLGYYGIFQLRDSLFCDSGYRWSKNLCGKPCTDFTDDDITDDIDCFLSTNYHWYLIRGVSHQCFQQRKTFLKDCS